MLAVIKFVDNYIAHEQPKYSRVVNVFVQVLCEVEVISERFDSLQTQ